MREKLLLWIGSTRPFDVFLFDENDVAEDLSGATAATLVIKRSASESDANAVLVKKTTDAQNPLVIDSANSKLRATMTQTQAGALVAGSFVGQAAIQFASGWQLTDFFSVEIDAAAAPLSV